MSSLSIVELKGAGDRVEDGWETPGKSAAFELGVVTERRSYVCRLVPRMSWNRTLRKASSLGSLHM